MAWEQRYLGAHEVYGMCFAPDAELVCDCGRAGRARCDRTAQVRCFMERVRESGG